MEKVGDHSFLRVDNKIVFVGLILTLYCVYVSESQSST